MWDLLLAIFGEVFPLCERDPSFLASSFVGKRLKKAFGLNGGRETESWLTGRKDMGPSIGLVSSWLPFMWISFIIALTMAALTFFFM